MKPLVRKTYTSTVGHRGIGLIELLLSISVIATIAVSSIALYSSVSAANKAQEMIRGYKQITSTARALYGGKGSYLGLGANQLALSGALPLAMVSGTSGGAGIVSPFGLMAIPAIKSPGYTFDVVYQARSIPRNVCVQFVPALLSSAMSVKIGNVSIVNAEDVIVACNKTTKLFNSSVGVLIAEITATSD